MSGVLVAAGDFDPAAVPAHLRMTVVVADGAGAVLDVDHDVAAIQRRLASTARAAIAAAVPLAERRGIVTWDVGTVPRVVEGDGGDHVVRGFPALLDDDDSVSLRVLTNPDLQQRVMRGGVRRLLLLTAGFDRPPSALAAECRVAAVDAVVTEHGALPWDETAFEALRDEVRRRAPAIARQAVAAAEDVLTAAARVRARLARMTAPALQRSVADAAEHLDRLVRSGFVLRAGVARLDDLHRYVRAIEYRLERLADDVPRDLRRMDELAPLEERYAALVRRPRHGSVPAPIAEVGWSARGAAGQHVRPADRRARQRQHDPRRAGAGGRRRLSSANGWRTRRRRARRQ